MNDDDDDADDVDVATELATIICAKVGMFVDSTI
jgi:hypothetical protein